jgi:hypothetical protein
MNKSYFMARGWMLRIEDGAESVIHVRSGALWLTQERDGRDYYLAAGSTFRLDRDGLAVAQATRRSSVTLTAAHPVGAAKARTTLGAWVGRLWAGLFAPHGRPTTALL